MWFLSTLLWCFLSSLLGRSLSTFLGLRFLCMWFFGNMGWSIVMSVTISMFVTCSSFFVMSLLDSFRMRWFLSVFLCWCCSCYSEWLKNDHRTRKGHAPLFRGFRVQGSKFGIRVSWKIPRSRPVEHSEWESGKVFRRREPWNYIHKFNNFLYLPIVCVLIG